MNNAYGHHSSVVFPVRTGRLFLIICLFLLFSARLVAQQQIVINELGIAPSVVSNNSGGGSEFVELFNKSGCAVNIGCYVLVYSGSDPFFGNPTGWAITIPANTILQPDSFYLIGGGGGKNAYPIGPWQSVPGPGSPWKNIWGNNGKDIADLDISTSSNSALNTIPGLLIDNYGQVTLLKPNGNVESSVSYNMGNNPNSYPGGFSNAAAGCSSINLSDPGSSPNNFNNQNNGKFGGFIPGIYLDSSGFYQRTFGTDNPNLTPGKPNITQLKSSGGFAAPIGSATQQPTCTAPTGSITLTAPIGTGYTYSINGTTYQTSLSFSGLAAGNYKATVKNAGGCISAPKLITINNPPTPPVAPIVSVTQPTCSTPSGYINVTTPTGTGLSYSINGTSYQSSTTFNNVGPGQYSVTVKDAGGCVSSGTPVTINASPSAPAAPSVSVTQPTCSSPMGAINVTAPTGTGLSYSINGTSYQSSTAFNNVGPGQYSVTVRDAGGCVSSGNLVTINASPSAPAAPSVSVTQPTCSSPMGAINVTAPTGTGLSYSINGAIYQSSTTFNNVGPGQYSVTLKDAGECVSSGTPVTINIAPSAPVAPTVSTTQPTNCSNPKGSINISSPIDVNYTYSNDRIIYQTSPIFTALSPGQYNITVRNSQGCTSPNTIDVINGGPSAPSAPLASVTKQPTCSDPSGTITVTGPSGVGFTYSINGVDYTSSPVFYGAAPGKYNVTDKDGMGCISSATILTVNASGSAEPAPFATVTQQATCSNPNATITITSPTGAGYTYSDNGTDFQTSPVFMVSKAGEYSLYSKSGTGCISLPFTITVNPAGGAPSPDLSIKQPTCSVSTGSIEIISPTGPGYLYTIDSISYQASSIFNLLSSGNYEVRVKNSDGCISQAAGATISPELILKSERYPTVSIGSLTPVVLQGRSLSSNDMYLWEPHVGLSSYRRIDPTFNYSTSTEYLIQINSVGGCSVIDTLLVKIIGSDSINYNGIYVPTAFSPNGDSRNDKLTPHLFKLNEYKYFRIYNRWGQLVFQTHKEVEGWDGNYHGVPQPAGVFLWTLELLSTDDKLIDRQGSFLLLR